MLGALRRRQRWLLWGVIVLVGGVFVLYLGVGGPGPGSLPPQTVLDVDGRRYTVRDVLRVRQSQEDRYREALGEQFDAQAASDLLDQLAVSSLEATAFMAIAAEQVGLRASDAEVRRVVQSFPGAIDESGRFDADWVRFSAEREYGTERRFVESLRDSLLQEKLLRLLEGSVDVSAAEARDSLRVRREEVRLAYVSLDPEAVPADLAVPEAEIEHVLADEDRLRGFYEEKAERYRLPERVRARHILLRVEADASPEQVDEQRGRAQGILARLLAGEDFAELAGEVSEDPGTKASGGDLGFFTRGQMTRPFEEAAFALPPGELSDAIRSDFGFHIVRVEERRPAEERPFDDVKAEIALELARADVGGARARDTTQRLAEAIRQGRSLEEAARAEELTLERPDWIRRSREGQIPGLGPAPEVVTAAFALPDEQPSSARIFEVGERLVLVQRLERRAPDPAEPGEQLEQERERLQRLRSAQARELWIGGTRQELFSKGRVVRDLAPLGGS
jgi:peptidyl-prolyl cis-trans isomerase D